MSEPLTKEEFKEWQRKVASWGENSAAYYAVGGPDDIRQFVATIEARDAEIAGANRVIARMKESGRELAHNAREEIADLTARLEKIRNEVAQHEKALGYTSGAFLVTCIKGILAQPTAEEVRDDEA